MPHIDIPNWINCVLSCWSCSASDPCLQLMLSHPISCIWWHGGYATKPISSVLLFSQFYITIKTNIAFFKFHRLPGMDFTKLCLFSLWRKTTCFERPQHHILWSIASGHNNRSTVAMRSHLLCIEIDSSKDYRLPNSFFAKYLSI